MADEDKLMSALAAQDRYEPAYLPDVPSGPDEQVTTERQRSQRAAQLARRGEGVNPVVDIIKSIPAAAARGAKNFLLQAGSGADPIPFMPEVSQEQDRLGIEGAHEMDRQIEAAVKERLYQPQTTPGHYGHSVFEIGTNPINWIGPGSIPFKAGWNVASGIGGEAGAQAYKGTPYEETARTAGSFSPMVAERAAALAPGALAKLPGAFEAAFNAAVPSNAAGIIGGRIPRAPPRLGDIAERPVGPQPPLMQAERRMGDVAAQDRLPQTFPEYAQRSYPMPAAPPSLSGDTRVSTRFPTAVGATEDPLKQQLSIGLKEMQASPGYEKNIGVLSQYPGFAHLEAMGTDEAARAYINQAADNLKYLYHRSPDVMKQRSPLWYEGAHEFSDALARRWGIPRPAVSGGLASLSPQMDWFKNASLGERTGDILTSAAAGRLMTPDMVAMARSPKMSDLFSGPKSGDINREMLRSITGKTLDQITDPLEQALWLRLYDEAHHPRSYRTITPEGNLGDFVRKKGGEPANVGWGGLGEIEKAIISMRSGGDMKILSPALGNMHKVRSFYNNIENPNYPLFGDVTADTHQVAGAQLRPLSGNAPAVEQNLTGGAGASSSAISGVRGTYGLTADATRRAAAELGLVPRAAQSATWEPVRELFTKTWKTPANLAKVDNIWRAYDRGEISIGQARDAIFNAAGGIGTPSWAGSSFRAHPPSQASTYR